MKHHLYADGTNIYVAITPDNASSAMTEFQKCLRSVQDSIAASKLKLNPDKTELFFLVHLLSRLVDSHVYPVKILGNLLHPSSYVDCA